MAKNYFTDEQLNAIHKEICRLEDLESGTSLPFKPLNNVEASNLRRICNLAVEAAIGEPKAYLVDGRIEQGLFFDKTSAISMANANCGEFKSLHTVQELDN